MEHWIQQLDNNTNDPEVVLEIINQINSYYVNLVDYSKIDQDLAYTFPQRLNQDEPVGGLLQFLKSQITLKPHDKAKELAYQLISWIIQNSRIPRPILQGFIIRFKEIADLTWRNQNERSRVQNAALDVLITIVRVFGGSFRSHELEAAQLYQNLLVNSERSCFQPSVRGQMFHLLGLLASTYAHDILDTEPKCNQLFNHLVLKLKEEVECSHRHLEAAILLGTIRALDAFLNSFESELVFSPENILKLYKKLEQIVDPKCSIDHDAQDTSMTKLKKREFQRAGLELIAHHGALFEKYLAQYYSQWFSDLISWVKSNNTDDSRAGMKAMFRFLETVSTYYENLEDELSESVVETSTSVSQVDSPKVKVVKFFITKFVDILDRPESHSREVTVAVKGYGLLSKICQDNDYADDLMFKRIMKKVEAILGEMDSPFEAKTKYEKYSSVSLLPTYVETIGHILFSMKTSDEESLATFQNRLLIIEDLAIALAVHFPKLNEKYQNAAYYSFNEVLKSLYVRHYKWCRPFLEKVAHEGLIHAIASPTKAEVNLLNESYSMAGNEKSLKKMQLYTVDLYAKFWINVTKLGHREFELPVLTYDVIMSWISETIKKLDLSLEFIDEDDVLPSDQISVDPVYNTRATTARDFQLFINLVEFMETFVRNVHEKYFSKWINVFIDETIAFVEKFPLVSGFYKMIALAFDVIRKLNIFENCDEDENAKQLLTKCSEFVVTLSAKTEEFRDDLLLSVLNIWLSAPDEIILLHFTHLGETMKMVFRVGRTSFNLAARGVDALERWFLIEKINPSDVEVLFRELFPILKTYFTSMGEEELVGDIIAQSQTNKSKPNSIKKSKGHLHQRRVQQMILEKKDVTLRKLQLSLLKLFGSYGHLLNLNSTNDSQIQMSVEEKFLKYAIPFQDIKPDLYLDHLLPRINELCDLASERQLRTSACECLHSLVLYFLGHSVRSDSSSSHGELFIKLFGLMIKLGCDNDTVVRQLFNPLTIQVVHWFTRKNFQNYGDIVLQIISDGLVQTEDAQIRDFSAVCMSEFFKWCTQHENNSKVAHVMQTLCAMGTHSAPKYRQGSVLAFNNIYRQFREDPKLVSKYTLQLIHSYLVSLCLPYNNTSGESILVKSTQIAIRHLERIIIKKQDSFNTGVRGSDRKYPAELKGPTLKDLVNWIFRQCGESSTAVGRETCIGLVHTLAPHIRGMGSTEEYLRTFEAGNGANEILNICEKCFKSKEKPSDETSDFAHTLKCLNASADIYLGLQSGAYPIAKLLQLPQSKFSQTLAFFLNFELTLFQANSAAFTFFVKVGQLINSVPDCFDFVLKKSFIKLGLLVSKMANGKSPHLQKIFSTLDKMWHDMSRELDNNFTSELKNLMQLGIDFRDGGIQKLNLPLVENLIAYTKWFHEIISHKQLVSVLSIEEKNVLAKNIWNYVMSSLYTQKSGKHGEIWVSPSYNFKQTELLQSLVGLSFGLGWEEGVTIATFDSTPVQTETATKAVLTKGDVFQQALLPVFCFNEKLTDFSHLLSQTRIENVGHLIQSLVTYVKNQKELRKRFGKHLVSSTLAIWQQLHLNCEPNVLSRIISGLCSLDFNYCKNSKEFAKWWSGSTLLANPNLTFKEKSEFIHFFGLFARSPDSELVNDCISGVDALVKQSLNLQQSDQIDWSQEEQYISKVFFKMVFVYESMAENVRLLEIIIRYIIKSAILCEAWFEKNSENNAENSKEPENVCTSEIRNRLRKIVESASDDVKLKIAEVIFKAITMDSNLECRENLSGSTFCLIPVIGAMSDNSLKKFFRQNIFTITQQAEAKIQGLATKSVWNLRTIAMTLIEMLALRMPNEFITGDLNQCYFQQMSSTSASTVDGSDPKLLFKKLVRIAQGYRGSPIPSQKDQAVRAANFSFNAASFNATVALAKVGKLSMKHFTGFIFLENERSANDFIWSNIVDTKPRYTFPVIMDQAVGGNKIVDDKTSRPTSKPVEISFEHNNRGVVMESSLADDATRFDFTTSVSLATSPFYHRTIVGVESSQKANVTTAATPSETLLPETSLEWSVVNEHPCMFALIEAMKQMATFPQSGTEEPLPTWVHALKALIEKPTVHSNIKAFVIGAMINCDEVFKPYATHFVDSIIKCILSDTFSTSETVTSATQGLNYFVKDIVIMLLGWSEHGKPNPNQIKSVLEYFMVRVENSRKDISENNLQILQEMLTRWVYKDSSLPFDETLIPYTFITEALQGNNTSLGLSLIKSFCLSKILPCELNNVGSFGDMIAQSFKSTSKTINVLGGEATGLLFRVLESIKFPYLDKALERMKEKKLDREKGRVQSYLNILTSIGKYYPPFLLPFKNEIMSYLRNPTFRDQVLSILILILQEETTKEPDQDKRNQLVHSLHADLEGRGIFSMPLKTNLDAGVEFLHLVTTTNLLNKKEKILQLLEWTQQAGFEVKPLRAKFASIVAHIYSKLGGHNNDNSTMSKMCEKMFIRLLFDEDSRVQDVVKEFWSSNLEGWTSSPNLFLELMELLGDNTKAIAVLLDLMMKRCSSSPDFTKYIFDKDLEDCTFINYDINTSWRGLQSSMNPLFAESLSSSQTLNLFPKSIQSSILSQRTGTQFGMNVLRATLRNPLFTQTQENVNVPEHSQSQDGGSPMDVSFDFESDFMMPLPSLTTDSSKPSNSLNTLRRRFYERSETPYYAIREVERQQTLIESDIETLRKRRAGVKLSRTYRIGELPDIKMKNSELLANLISLVKKDEELGKIVMVLLGSSFVNELKRATDKEAENFITNAAGTFDKLFSAHGHGLELSSQFAEAILEISTCVQIPIQPQLISTIATNFGLERMGILKLENEIDTLDSVPPKRPKLEQTDSAVVWLRLCEMYKQLEDFDTVRNVFSHIQEAQTNTNEANAFYEKAREALYLESLSKFSKAKDLYEELYGIEKSKAKNDPLLLQLFDDAIDKMLAHMSDWDGEYARCHQFYMDHHQDLWSDKYKVRILPRQLLSGVQAVLRNIVDNEEDTEECEEEEEPEADTPNSRNLFNAFLQMLKEDENEWKNVIVRYPTLLSILHLTDDDVHKSRSFLDNGWEITLNWFQSFEKLTKNEKRLCFLELQRSSTLSDVLDWFNTMNYSVSHIEERTISLVEKWRRSTASTTMPLLNADLIVEERSAFLKKMVDKMENLMLEAKEDLVDDITRLQFEQCLWVVNLACKDGNFDVGERYLMRAWTLVEDSVEEVQLKWRNSLCTLLTTCEYAFSTANWIKKWASSWKKLATLENESNDVVHVHEVQSELLQSLIHKVSREKCTSKKILMSLGEAFASRRPIGDYESLMNVVLKNAISLVGKVTENNESSVISDLDDAAMKFYQLLQTILGGFPEKYADNENLYEKLLICLFHSMQNGHKLAQKLFPRCFNILERFPALIEKLSDQMTSMQSWIFLPWLDQIATYYKHKPTLRPVLKPILEKLIQEYPQSFQLQYSDLDLVVNSSTFPPVLKHFQEALNALTFPHILLRKSIRAIRSCSSLKPLKSELTKLVQFLQRIQQLSDYYGRIHQEYVGEILPRLETIFQELQENNFARLKNELSKLLDPARDGSSLKKSMYDRSGKLRDYLNLKDLSPWLANYHFSAFQDVIEVPGLYHGFKRPETNMHPNIVSFESTVKIYESLAKPMGLTVMANNGKRYKFLLKCGDDLRQDKRLQQLFSLFTEILVDDPKCRERDLHILTYEVIPISNEFGMIELVEKTKSLKDFILNSAKYREAYNNRARLYNQTISRGKTNSADAYGVFASKPRREAEAIFDQASNTLPVTLFSDHVKNSSESLHSFFLLREKLIRSHATMCIVHYLLGIGDRHWENIMLKLNSGQFLGIDFGHAFGTSTVNLPVPELVPFRCTPQLQALMRPYGVNGIFKETMMHVWRAIVKSSERISSVVEIFITEPTIDWSRNVKSAATNSNVQGTSTVQLLHDKLDGRNPLEILGKLLHMNTTLQSNQTWMDNWQKVLVDGRESQASLEILSDEQLVDMLISLATDRNVLGKMYLGWSAWV